MRFAVDTLVVDSPIGPHLLWPGTRAAYATASNDTGALFVLPADNHSCPRSCVGGYRRRDLLFSCCVWENHAAVLADALIRSIKLGRSLLRQPSESSPPFSPWVRPWKWHSSFFFSKPVVSRFIPLEGFFKNSSTARYFLTVFRFFLGGRGQRVRQRQCCHRKKD